jgi:hypothetical protein
MQRIGPSASIDEQESEVVRLLSLTPQDISEIHEANRTEFSYRLAWARTYLKNLNLIESSERGIWTLTTTGRKYSSIADLRNANPDAFEDLFDNTLGLEGLDEGIPESFGEYPIDSVLIRTESRTVYEVVRRIRDGRFIMDPDFQRDFIWTPDKQSKLIESMLMRIPLPVFYLAERDDGKAVVVDGLQRLTTFGRFLDDKLPLQNLELAVDLNGRTFTSLSPKLRNRVEDTQLVLYLIDFKVPEQAKLDIFERVNGGVPLTRQQMRNSIYSGPATRWLKSEARSDEFLAATARTLDWRTMRDRECVNRFCAFRCLGVDAYKRGDMDAFLASALKKMNDMESSQLASMSNDFRRSMRNNLTIFGEHAFRKHSFTSAKRSVINVALFDVFSILLTEVSENKAQELAERIHSAFFKMMEDSTFLDAISFSTNSTRKVKSRFEIARSIFGDLLPNVENA